MEKPRIVKVADYYINALKTLIPKKTLRIHYEYMIRQFPSKAKTIT